MFQSQNLGFARKHFDSLAEGDVSKQFAHGKAEYRPPTSWWARDLSLFAIESKINDLKKFYPHEKHINETVKEYNQYMRVTQDCRENLLLDPRRDRAALDLHLHQRP